MKRESKFCKFRLLEFKGEDSMYLKLLSPRPMYRGMFIFVTVAEFLWLSNVKEINRKKILSLIYLLLLPVNESCSTEVIKIHAKLIESTETV